MDDLPCACANIRPCLKASSYDAMHLLTTAMMTHSFVMTVPLPDLQARFPQGLDGSTFASGRNPNDAHGSVLQVVFSAAPRSRSLRMSSLLRQWSHRPRCTSPTAPANGNWQGFSSSPTPAFMPPFGVSLNFNTHTSCTRGRTGLLKKFPCRNLHHLRSLKIQALLHFSICICAGPANGWDPSLAANPCRKEHGTAPVYERVMMHEDIRKANACTLHALMKHVYVCAHTHT